MLIIIFINNKFVLGSSSFLDIHFLIYLISKSMKDTCMRDYWRMIMIVEGFLLACPLLAFGRMDR